MNRKEWKKMKSGFNQEQEELRPIYEKVKSLLSPKERQFLELYFSSSFNKEFYQKVKQELGITLRYIRGRKRNLLNELKECRDNYDAWIEKRNRPSKKLRQEQEAFRPIYEKAKPLLPPKTGKFAELYFTSTSYKEIYQKTEQELGMTKQHTRSQKWYLLKELKECHDDYDGWVQKKQRGISQYGSNQKQEKNNKHVKTKEEYENLYYLYQPYIPLEYQQEFEFWLKQSTEPISEKCIVVKKYLSCCDLAMHKQQSLPNFQQWIITYGKKTKLKKDVTIEFLNSISREEIMILISQLQSIPDNDAYYRLYEFYGINTTRHSVEQLHEMYPELSILTIKNELKKTVISIQKKVSELLLKKKIWERERQELLSKFTFSSFELGKLEAICINYYYGFTVAPIPLSEISKKVYYNEQQVEKFINHAKLILKQSKVAKNPVILASVEKISNVNEKNILQLQDKDFRALRLMVQQALTMDKMELSSVQEKLLTLFFGFPDNPIKSSKEIAFMCGCTEQDVRIYLIETIRYVLNYISKETLESEFHESQVEKQLTHTFKS